MKCLLIAVIGIIGVSARATAQDLTQDDAESRLFLPHDFIRGFAGFELAPPHNEPDLGFCAPLPSGVHSSPCAAYARYVWTGHVEIQPVGRGFLRNLYFFIDPRMFLGDNIPQVRYTASSAPIAWEREVGVAVQLPRGFEIRATHHDVALLGKYRFPSSVANLSTNGPLGLYSTVGVRWYFGAYGRAGMHE
jgi:hypothetical protein